MKIRKVIYSNPVTVVFWDDGDGKITKTMSRCDSADTYDELTGFLMCVMKKIMRAKDMRKMLANYVYGDNPKYIKRDKKNKPALYSKGGTLFIPCEKSDSTPIPVRIDNIIFSGDDHPTLSATVESSPLNEENFMEFLGQIADMLSNEWEIDFSNME